MKQTVRPDSSDSEWKITPASTSLRPVTNSLISCPWFSSFTSTRNGLNRVSCIFTRALLKSSRTRTGARCVFAQHRDARAQTFTFARCRFFSRVCARSADCFKASQQQPILLKQSLKPRETLRPGQDERTQTRCSIPWRAERASPCQTWTCVLSSPVHWLSCTYSRWVSEPAESSAEYANHGLWQAVLACICFCYC